MFRLKQLLPKVVFLCALILGFSVVTHAQKSDKPGALTSSTCYSPKTKLYCESYGDKRLPPMLFIHGLGASLYSWRFMIAPLSGTYRVILIDLRGAGKSPKPDDKNYSILDQAELLHQFILEQDLKRLTLVGNSYGGAVSLLLAMRLCAEKPARLSNLILIDAGGYPDHLPSHLLILRTPIIGWLAVHLIPPKIQIAIVLHESYAVPARITEPQIEAYARPIAEKGGRHALLQLAKQAIPKEICDYIDRYDDISVPTLIIWGDKDQVLPPLIGERFDCAIPNSHMIYIASAGHVPQEEQPDATVCQIKKFLMPNTTCNPVTVEQCRCGEGCGASPCPAATRKKMR